MHNEKNLYTNLLQHIKNLDTSFQTEALNLIQVITNVQDIVFLKNYLTLEEKCIDANHFDLHMHRLDQLVLIKTYLDNNLAGEK